MDLKSQALRVDFLVAQDPVTGEPGRISGGELSIELTAVGPADEVAAIAEAFRRQPGSLGGLASFSAALGIGVPILRAALRSRLLLRADEAAREAKSAWSERGLSYESATANARKDAFREAAAMLEEMNDAP